MIHHKFIVIDAEGANPVVYTKPANMSRNSEQYNDENLLEIRDQRIAAIYLAEFLRLYEHYRARALAINAKQHGTDGGTGAHARLALAPDSSWAKSITWREARRRRRGLHWRRPRRPIDPREGRARMSRARRESGRKPAAAAAYAAT